MSGSDAEIAALKNLVELVDKNHLAEITVTEGDLTITVKGSSHPVTHQPTQAQTAEITYHEQYLEDNIEYPEEIAEYEDDEQNIYNITAPLVGVFYRAQSPDSPNFVEIGDHIEAGTEVGLIEAMKVFSPIPSDVAGEVIEIPAQNGKLVQQGDILIRIRVAESGIES